MSVSDLLADGFGRVQEVVHQVLDGLTVEDLAFRADEQANSIGWLIWHLSRVQDDHIADAAGLDQVWLEGWQQRAALPFAQTEIGYGQDPAEVSHVRLSGDFLAGYYDATHAQTISFVSGLRDADLAAVVDSRWDPPVTLGVRLISVISDDLQHAGQAAFVRGIVQRR
jgi:DinB superfamily